MSENYKTEMSEEISSDESVTDDGAPSMKDGVSARKREVEAGQRRPERELEGGQRRPERVREGGQRRPERESEGLRERRVSLGEAEGLSEEGGVWVLLETVGAHFKVILLIIFVIICGIFVAFFVTKSDKSVNNDIIMIYEEEFRAMEREFPGQSLLSWKVVNVTVHRHFLGGHESLRPAVINLVGETKRIEKLVSRISTVLTRSKVSNQCQSLRSLDQTNTTDSMIISIEDFIQGTLKKGSRCVHVPDLDKINPALGPYFHGLTDEITARYKDIFYIFSLSTPYKSHRDNVEKHLVSLLSDAWIDEMGPERFDALMSRLAINVVSVE